MKSLIGKELTRKGEDKLYLILYSKPENGIIELPCSFEKKMVKAHMLHNKESIKTTQLKAQNKCLIDVSSICGTFIKYYKISQLIHTQIIAN